MSHERRRVGVIAAGAAALALLASPFAAFAQDAEATDGAAEATAGATTAGSATASVSEECQADNLGDVLKNEGRLTVSTDNPAFFPWFSGPVPEGSEWASFGQYPPSGQGFESAIAYAIAEQLGFTREQVAWIGQAGFGLAFAPGEKDFDIHLGQVSILPERAEAVDFSDPYFDVQQAVVALADNPITDATTIEELKAFDLGAQVNSTSLLVLEQVVQPDTDIQVYDNNNDAKFALENGQIDGLVVDTPTAFYIRDVELEREDTPGADAAIVGQIVTDEPEQFGIILDKDSPLTPCVNEAIAAIKASGRYQEIYDAWIGGRDSAPQLQ